MTTHAVASPPTPTSRGPVAEPPARFRHLLTAEWIKMRSLRSTPWTLALLTLFVIGASAVTSLDSYHDLSGGDVDGPRPPMFALLDAFPMTGYWTLMLVAASAGAITIVSEYSSGLIRTTTVAVPARGSVVLAKAVVVASVWTVVGAVIATGSFVVSQAILSARGASISITEPAAVRALLASALLAPVCALIGLGFGAVIRHSATTMVASICTLLMLPAFFSEGMRWSAELSHLMMTTAWGRLILISVPPPGDGFYRPTVVESWIVYAAWPLVAIVAAVLVVRRRDV